MVLDFKDCPYCNWSELDDSNYCRRCGKPMHINLKRRINCPICGNPIKNYSEFCEHCGSQIARDLNYAIRFSNVKKCISCNNMNESDSKICSNCGNKLPIVTELNIIKCPDCNNQIRDDVNFCRFCGHSFIGYETESKEKFRLFTRKIKSSTNLLTANNKIHCENCGKDIYGPDAEFCIKCSSPVPKRGGYYLASGMKYEEFNLKLANQFIVPLSKYYKTNFRKTTLRDYFNLTKEQELHIIYVIMEKLKKNDNEDVVNLFEATLRQTKEDYCNLEEVILNSVKKDLKKMFNSHGISASDVTTVKSSYYDTVETPVVQNKHGGLTKSAAFLGFGFLGLAATSGVKTTIESKEVFRSGEYTHYQITFNNRGIVLKLYNSESSSKSFDSKKGSINQSAIKYEDIYSFDTDNFTFFLESGENFKCPPFDLKYIVRRNILKIIKTYYSAINDQFIQDYIDKINEKDINSIVAELINEQITSAKNSKNNIQQKTNVDIGGLEKIVEMYEKGFLTDEEFITMKQNIIRNNSVIEEDKPVRGTGDNSQKFCGNCGAEVIDDSKFCIKCGTQIK